MRSSLYLSTGIDKLDNLLSPDQDNELEKNECGILMHYDKNKLRETPVILIQGASGVGKTTLALQIAYNVVKQNATGSDKGEKDPKGFPWRVFLYNLEQGKRSLENIAENYEWKIGDKKNRIYQEINECKAEAGTNELINLCQFSPHPLDKLEDEFVFEQRKSELQHVIDQVCEKRKKKDDGGENFHPLFIMDSLTAFADRNLSRNQVHQLFSLFRNNDIPVIMTVEQFSRYTSDEDTIALESAKFLADVVIELSIDNSNYFKYQLEISKSKICRQGLGKHLYKIRTKDYYKNSADKENRPTGIVLFPSIHYVVSAISTKELVGASFQIKKPENLEPNEDSKDLDNIFHEEEIARGSCIAIVGPEGCHKLTLAVNIAAALHNSSEGDVKKGKILIVNFGDKSDFKFGGIAWTKTNEKYSRLKKTIDTSENASSGFSRVKFWYDKYGIKGKGDSVIDVITYRMGHLSPEECFDAIQRKINENSEKKDGYIAAILSNTAEICTCFPQLANDSLFLPSLIELFSTQKIVSICNCIKTHLSHSTQDANLAILSKSNYRIYLSQYPTIEELSEKIVYSSQEHITQQLTSLIIDNVSGKDYRRRPVWLRVSQESDPGKPKKFLCEKNPHTESN